MSWSKHWVNRLRIIWIIHQNIFLWTSSSIILQLLSGSFVWLALCWAVLVCFLPPEIRELIRPDWHFEDKFDKLCTFYLWVSSMCNCVPVSHKENLIVFRLCDFFFFRSINFASKQHWSDSEYQSGASSAGTLTRVNPKVWHRLHLFAFLLFDVLRSGTHYPIPSPNYRWETATSADSRS